MDKKSALVVDDEHLTLKIISDILEIEGYEVKTATTYGNALQHIKSSSFHVVITDIRMPEKSGIDLLEDIRSVNPELPVILMTGFASINTAIEAVKGGAYDYLTKPLDYNKLKCTIQHAVERYELLQENKRLFKELNELNVNLEQKVRERNRDLENILTSTYESIVTTDRDLRIKTANPKTAYIYGEDCIGRKLNELVVGINFDSVIPQILSDPSITSSHEVKYGDKFLEVSLSPLVDSETAEIFGAIAVTNDITEKKKLEMQLIQSAKMSAIGQLASGVAHEFNNILSAIVGYTGLALLRKSVEEIREDLKVIEKASSRATDITSKLLSFSRPKEDEFQLASMVEVIEDTVALIRHSFESDGVKILLHNAKIPPIRMNASEIQQVILNLVINSKHAMSKDGMIVISTELDEEYVKVDCSDTGYGIPKDIIPKIFDPFFSTKDSNASNQKPGSGLGLSTVYAILERHGGRISVSSVVGMGTTFTFWLPNIQRLSTAQETDKLQNDDEFKAIETRKKGNILVVDDEETICGILREFLLRIGHNVVTASNGDTAIEHVRKNHFDIVFLDLAMPGKSGLDALKEIKLIDTSTVVVIISGGGEENLKDKAIGQGAFSFLHKPFTLLQIQNTVARILGAE